MWRWPALGCAPAARRGGDLGGRRSCRERAQRGRGCAARRGRALGSRGDGRRVWDTCMSSKLPAAYASRAANGGEGVLEGQPRTRMASDTTRQVRPSPLPTVPPILVWQSHLVIPVVLEACYSHFAPQPSLHPCRVRSRSRRLSVLLAQGTKTTRPSTRSLLCPTMQSASLSVVRGVNRAIRSHLATLSARLARA